MLRITERFKKEVIEKEDKKYLMEELQKLGLKDLETVAGGFDLEELTEEERKTAFDLQAKLIKAASDHSKGLITSEELAAVEADYRKYITMLMGKYDGFKG